MTDAEMARAVEKVTEVLEKVGDVDSMNKVEYVEFLRALLDEIGDRYDVAVGEL